MRLACKSLLRPCACGRSPNSPARATTVLGLDHFCAGRVRRTSRPIKDFLEYVQDDPHLGSRNAKASSTYSGFGRIVMALMASARKLQRPGLRNPGVLEQRQFELANPDDGKSRSEKEFEPELDGPACALLVRDRTKCRAA